MYFPHMTETNTIEDLSRQPTLHNGTYTVSGEGQHYTLRVKTSLRGKLAGKRIISLLTGPDNQSDYTGLAFWNDEQERAFMFKSRVGKLSPRDFPVDALHWSTDWGKAEKKVAVFLNLALVTAVGDSRAHGFWTQRGYTIQASTFCSRCNRPLTDPTSITLGIGPVCRGDS